MNEQKKQKIEDISLNWAEQIKEAEILRWKTMYGFTPKKLADHYLSILDKTIKSKLEAVENEIELKRRKHYNEQQPFLKHRNDYNDAYNQIIIDVLEIINKHK
jgi:hypothetical protein